MENGRSKAILLGVLTVWAALSAPTLAEQWQRNSQVRRMLAGADPTERAQALDNPAFSVAHQIAEATPEDACITILAYAGPAAIDYYSARLDYLLYPRRVAVSADAAATSVECEYLAVFRDTPANLNAEPFSGTWDAEALAERTATFESVLRSERVSVYRRP